MTTLRDESPLGARRTGWPGGSRFTADAPRIGPLVHDSIAISAGKRRIANARFMGPRRRVRSPSQTIRPGRAQRVLLAERDRFQSPGRQPRHVSIAGHARTGEITKSDSLPAPGIE